MNINPINNIWIVIPTFRRAEILADCLKSISEMTSSAMQISLVLVDNDDKQTARPVFDSFSHNFPFSFFYIHEPKKGVSRARNRGIKEAIANGAQAILFVDDDMRLPPDYLRLLIAEMIKRRADAARGAMRHVKHNYENIPRRASLFLRRDMLPCNGALVATRVFTEWNIYFDPRFPWFEDGDFFYRIYLRGGRLFLVPHVFFYELIHREFRYGKDQLLYLYSADVRR